MGEVFRALDAHLARAVALKVLAPGLVHDEASRERILRESQLAASLDHPNVIPIYAAGEADGHVYIAMRLVEGSDLRSVLRRDGQLAPGARSRLATQIAAALDAAHARGLVHRDVKPSNVLIDQQQDREHCYLADFGVTTRADGQAVRRRLAAADGHAGIRRARADSRRCRRCPRGCLLARLPALRVPHRRGAVRARVRHRARLRAPRRAATEARASACPNCRPAFDAVIERALSKQPDDRQASCGDLVDDARRALALDEPGRSRRRLGALLAALAIAAAAVAVDGRTRRALRSGADSGAHGIGRPHRSGSGKVIGELQPVGASGRASPIGPQLWVADYRQGTLWRIDPRTGAATAFRPIGNPRSLAILGGRVYVGSDGPSLLGGNVTRYDARTGGRIDGVVNLVPCSVTAGAGRRLCRRLSQYPAPEHGRRRAADRVHHDDPASPAPADGGAHSARRCSAWPSERARSGRSAMRPTTASSRSSRARDGCSRTYALPIAPQRIAAGAGAVWITDAIHDVLIKVDPASGRVVQRIATGRGADGVAVGAGSVWVVERNRRHGCAHRPSERQDHRPHRGRHGAARGGGGAPWRLGDARCGSSLRGLALMVLAAASLSVAAGCGRVGTGAVPDRRAHGLHRRRRPRSHDWSLAGAELPLLQHGGRLIGKGPSSGVEGAKVAGRRVELVDRCSETGVYGRMIVEARRLVEVDHVDAVVGAFGSSDGIVLRELARRYPTVPFVIAGSFAREATVHDPAPNLYRFSPDIEQQQAGLATYAYRTLRVEMRGDRR